MNCLPVRFNGILRVSTYVLGQKKEDKYNVHLKVAHRLVYAVFEALKVEKSWLKVQTRKREVVDAKKISIHIIMDQCEITESEVAQIMNFDRSTVNWHKKTFIELRDHEKKFRDKYETVVKELDLKIK